MKIVKSIQKEPLIEAGIQCMKAADRYSEIVEHCDQEKLLMQAHPLDSRDLINLAVFLKFKRKLDGTGDVLTDAEFDAECKKMIEAFAHDDREQIFAYLDGWYRFATNYNAPENIDTYDEALKNLIYITSQQGISVMKLKDYPDFLRTRYPNLDSLMKLQKMQSEISMQTARELPLFMQYGITISLDAFRPFADGKNAPKVDEKTYKAQFKGLEEQFSSEAEYGFALLNAFDLTSPSPKDEVGVRKMEVPEDLMKVRGLQKTDKAFKERADRLSNAVHSATGTTQTGFGLLLEYTPLAGNLANYKLIYIDGVNVYDSLPDPKDVKEANARLVDALVNQSGVVTFAHVAHVNGKFEYRFDVLDTRTGKDDKPEYVEKIKALAENKENRKSLFKSCADELTNYFTTNYDNYIKNGFAKVQTDAKASVASGKNANESLLFPTPEINDDMRNVVGPTFQIVDECREEFLRYAHSLYKKRPDIREKLTEKKLDERDFQDLFLFSKMEKTFGIGERDIFAEDAVNSAEEMLIAFATDDHDGIKRYLDKMYDFLQNYQIPDKIETQEDWIKVLAYLRVQQTSVVKLVENPWYRSLRNPTPLDEAKFDSFEADYFVAYDDLLRTIKRKSDLQLGLGHTLAGILSNREKIRKFRAEELEAEGIAPEDAEKEFDVDELRSPYYVMARYMTSERRHQLENAKSPEFCHTFKLTLPPKALACSGDGVNPHDLWNEAGDFYTEFVDKLLNPSFTEATIVRSYHFKHEGNIDVMRQIFLDGRSVYDIVTDGETKKYESKTAITTLFSALVNQTALVQFAHISRGNGDDLNVELDTLDVTRPTCNKAEYLQKLADFELHRDERHSAVKEYINRTFKEHKKEIEDRIESTEKFYVEAGEQEAGILGMDSDLFASDDKKNPQNLTADAIRRRREESKERKEERLSNEQMQKAFENAEVLDLNTFKNGRYSVSTRSPHSAYALASMSEMRNLEVFFGSMSTKHYPKDYVKLVGTEDLEPDQKVQDAKMYAALNGLNINPEQLHSVMYNFVLQNLSDDNAHVDKTVFERQYMILFGDLYIQTLHALNRQASMKGEVMTSLRMDDALNALDKMMRNAASNVGYPETVFRGGFSPEGLKTLRENFVEKFVPKNATEIALRRIQANTKDYDFKVSDWKKPIGYTAFLDMIHTEKGKLNNPELRQYDKQCMAVQAVRAMEKYHNSRSRWSRFWNFRKSGKELRAIEEYKTLLKTNAHITDEQYANLYRATDDTSVSMLRREIGELYNKDKISAKQGEAVTESEFSQMNESRLEKSNLDEGRDSAVYLDESRSSVYGMGEKDENELDNSRDSVKSSESEKSEIPVKEEKPLVEKISAPEANEKVAKKTTRDQARENARKDLENKITRL